MHCLMLMMVVVLQAEDAIVCLDYIGHDFYVFRNQDTNEINVVYKRKEVRTYGNMYD